MSQSINVVVTGAAGQIGYALLFRLASGQAFGPNRRINLTMLEVEPALPALEGVAMELQDCAFPLLDQINMTSDPNVAMKNANWVVLVGAAPRKKGMERSDLLGANGPIFQKQGRAIAAHASQDVRVFVVGNPCNANALITMHNAQDVPKRRFFAMTRLDENRGCAQLAMKAGRPVESVKNMVIWGNHSATQYPDFYNATIDGKPALDVIGDEAWLQDTFIPVVQKRGAAVIEKRGASSAASAANGVIDSLSALSHDTTDIYSVACASQGEYGIDEGLIYSFPCQTKKGEVAVVEGFKHNAFAQDKLAITLAELREEKAAIESLGLI